jgi:hypothetical protein
LTTPSLRSAARLASALIVIVAVVTATAHTATPSVAVPTPTSGAAEPTPSREAHAADDAARDRAVERLQQVVERSHVAVSVRDEASGATFDVGSDRFPTASLVKVHLVALMSWRAERTGVALTAAQRHDAEEMIVRSDNDAALRAYVALGGRPGIEHGLTRMLGAAGIRVGDHGFWGHSVTTPREVVELLDRVLDPGARHTYALLQDAMSRVVPEQRWGISVLGDARRPAQMKVGWFEDPDGWIVNSSGRVVVDGHPLLVSVMTDRNPSLEAGVATIEQVARLAGVVVRENRRAPRWSWRDLGARIGAPRIAG